MNKQIGGMTQRSFSSRPFATCASLLFLLSASATQSPKTKNIMRQDTTYLQANGWVVSYSTGVKLVQCAVEAPEAPAATPATTSSKQSQSGSDCAWYFDFPSSPDSVHYITVPYTASKPHKFLSLTFKITALSGQPRFVSVETGCNRPASFRPMIERQGDNMNAEFYRWWSNPSGYDLAATGQSITLTIPLTPDKWSSVYGKFGNYDSQTVSEFNTTVKQIERVGITFGNGCHFGHGVYVSGGKARFELIDYRIK